VLTQLTLVNGVILHLIEDLGIGAEIHPYKKIEIPSDKKSKISGMLNLRDRLQNTLSRNVPVDKNLDLHIGNFYYFDAQYTRSLGFYDKLLKQEPNNPQILVNKAICTSKLGNHKEAISLYDKVLQLNPNYFDLLHFSLNMAKHYIVTNKHWKLILITLKDYTKRDWLY
jgi:tetratricopeptide (TPR) repeat protein